MHTDPVDQSQQHLLSVNSTIGLKFDILCINTLQNGLMAQTERLHQLHRLLLLVSDVYAQLLPADAQRLQLHLEFAGIHRMQTRIETAVCVLSVIVIEEVGVKFVIGHILFL
jgi:hypothetical protein